MRTWSQISLERLDLVGIVISWFCILRKHQSGTLPSSAHGSEEEGRETDSEGKGIKQDGSGELSVMWRLILNKKRSQISIGCRWLRDLDHAIPNFLLRRALVERPLKEQSLMLGR